MKIYLFLLILTFSCAAQINEADPYRYRPYIEFYEKGKEGLRRDEYLKYTNSDVSKNYLRIFSEEYDALKIYQVENYHRKNQITINKMVLHATLGKDEPVFNQFIGFFKNSFPESIRRMPDENSKTQILVFSGKEGSCVIYVPGVLGPEFAIVGGTDQGVKAGETYNISNFAMSATPPFEYFWEMFGAGMPEKSKDK